MTEEDSHPFHLDPGTVDYSRVAKVATCSKPVEVLLSRCDARLNVARADLSADWHDNAYIAYDTHLEARDGELFATRAAFLALYFPGLDPNVDAIPGFEEDDPAPALEIEAAFDLMYSLESTEGIDDEDLEHFAFVNSTLHAWPYWRELAQSMTTRMGLSPLIVAPFKIPSPYDPEDDEDANGMTDQNDG